MNKITSRPPKQKTPLDFIMEADTKSTGLIKRKVVEGYPWTDSSIRSDVQKVFTVKLLEEYIVKIKYISEITNKSQQKIVREIINSGIDEMLKSLEEN